MNPPWAITQEYNRDCASRAADVSECEPSLDWPTTPAPPHAKSTSARADFPSARSIPANTPSNTSIEHKFAVTEQAFAAKEDEFTTNPHGFAVPEHGFASKERGLAVKEREFRLKTLPCFLLSRPAD